MKIHAKRILLSGGWQQNQTLNIENGVIVSITDNDLQDAEQVETVIPGIKYSDPLITLTAPSINHVYG